MRSWLFLGIALLGVAALVSPLAGQTPAKGVGPNLGPAATGRILYVDTSEPGKNYLATILPDGTGKTRITPPYFYLTFPRYNRATGQIAFTNRRPDMKAEAFLLSRDGSKVVKLFDGVNAEGFSPDGKRLLYSTCDNKAELYVYSSESKKSIKVSQNLKITAADWSPDGDWIAASVLSDAGTNDLVLISTVAQGIEPLTETPDLDESFPIWASDSAHLAYISNRKANGINYIEYYLVKDRHYEEALIPGMYPAFSPDSHWLAFEAGNDIAIARRDGTGQKVLARGRTPTWIP